MGKDGFGSLLLVLTIFIQNSYCAVELPDFGTIDDTIRESFACRKNNPALSVSVVKDGKIVFAEGYGVESLESNIPVTNTTLFGIASLTKTFTTTLLAMLTDKNKQYSLNSRVAEFYGNNPVFDGYLRSKFATIKDLLAHRMGIPMHNFIRFDSKVDRRNLIRRLKELRPRGRFRDSFYYSNIMYGLAARLAEKIGKAKYEDLIANEIYQKLGMTDSDFFTTANESAINLAAGYLDVYGELHEVPFELSRRWSELCGANCILSSAIDMGKWMLFHLSHGKNQDGRRIMSESALEDTHRPENVLAKSDLSKYFTKPNVPETFSQTGYALGWRTGHYKGYNMLTHTGSSWGYKNMITLFPDMNVGIYTAMTGDDDDFLYRYSLHQYLADMYMGLTPWLNASLICSFPEPWLPAKPKRTMPIIKKDLKNKRVLDEYLGVYENPAYGKIEVFILDDENSTNKLIAEYGYVDLILYPKSRPDEFFFETDGIAAKLINFGTIQFRSKNGVIDRMRIPSFEPKDPPIFKRVEKPTEPTVDPKSPTDQTTGAESLQSDTAGLKSETVSIEKTSKPKLIKDTNVPKPPRRGRGQSERLSKTVDRDISPAVDVDLTNKETVGSQPADADITNSASGNTNQAPDTLSESQTGLADTLNETPTPPSKAEPPKASKTKVQSGESFIKNRRTDKSTIEKAQSRVSNRRDRKLQGDNVNVRRESTVDSVNREPVVKSSKKEPVVESRTTEPVVESRTTEPVVESSKTEPVVDSGKPEAVVDTTNQKPVVDSSKLSSASRSGSKQPKQSTKEAQQVKTKLKKTTVLPEVNPSVTPP